jgi:curved DNA-binding protein CbpA
MNPERDYYQILHVHPQAPREIIKSSYRTLMQRMRMHPDLGGDNDSAAIINEAYAVLMDVHQREAYDRSRLANAANDSAAGAEQAEQAEQTASASGHATGARGMGACRFCGTPAARHGGNIAAAFCAECDSPRFMSGQVEDDGSDRRAILRVPKNCPVLFCTHWPQSEPHYGRGEDVSLTGLRFRSRVGLQIGQLLKIDAQMLRAVAEVTRVIDHGGDWEVAVQFQALHFERTRGSFIADCV